MKRGPSAEDLAGQVVAVMSAELEPVRTIAARLGWEVMDTERALYALAGIRPGQIQPDGVGRVVNHRAVLSGVPVLWSLRDPGLVLLVTGSREWKDRAPIRVAFIGLLERWGVEPGAVTVRHGAQGKRDKDGRVEKGLDLLAEEVALELGMRVDPMPADWHGPCRPECKHGPRKVAYGRDYCPMAGFYRNAAMVARGARECFGFPIGRSNGTRDCMKRAKGAGIPITPFEG